jgi:hypothetical protein
MPGLHCLIFIFLKPVVIFDLPKVSPYRLPKWRKMASCDLD